MAYDIGDFRRLARRRDEGDRRRRLRRASAKARRRQAARHRLLLLHRGLRHRAVERRSAALGAGVGLWESAEVRVNPVGTIEVLTGSHSHGQGHETTFAQLVSERLGIPIEPGEIVHGDTDKVQFGMGTYGSRSARSADAIVKAMDKVEAKAKKIAAHMLEASEATSSSRTASSRSPAPTSRSRCRRVALAAYTAHNCRTAWSPA
jgi:carbon-monoxide dehydrogenase large subunit